MAEIALWTGELVGKMHCSRVTQDDIAQQLGVSRAYVSMILNGRKTSKNAERRFNDAYQAIIERRANEQRA